MLTILYGTECKIHNLAAVSIYYVQFLCDILFLENSLREKPKDAVSNKSSHEVLDEVRSNNNPAQMFKVPSDPIFSETQVPVYFIIFNKGA